MKGIGHTMATTMRQKQLQQQFRMENFEQNSAQEGGLSSQPSQKSGFKGVNNAHKAESLPAGSSASHLTNILQDTHAKHRELHERGLKNLQHSGSQTQRQPATDRSKRLAPKKWHEDTKGRDDYKNMLNKHLQSLEPRHVTGGEPGANNEIESNQNGDDNYNPGTSVSEYSHSREFSFDPQKQMQLG